MNLDKTTKTELFVFSAIDYNSLKEHFEEMARKGWLLEKISFVTAKYRKIEPSEITFSVDIYPKFSMFDAIDKMDVEAYINLCEEAGWKYATSANNLQIFYSVKEENLIPVQTDDGIKDKVIEKSIFAELFSMTMSLFVLINSFRISFPYDYEDLYSNLTLIFPIFLPLLMSIMFFFILSNLLWIIRAKKNIKASEPIPRTNYKFSKLKGTISLSISAISIVAIILSIVSDSLFGSSYKLIFLIPLILMPLISIFYQKVIKSFKISKYIKVLLLSIMVIVVYFVPIIYVVTTLGSSHNEDLELGYIGFTYEDFNIEGVANYKSFSKSGSIVVPRKSVYSEVSKGNSVKTVYIESKSDKIAKYIFDEMLIDSIEYNSFISDASKEYKSYDEAYYIENNNFISEIKNKVILLIDNKILLLDTEIDLSQEENIKIINSKLFN